MNKVHLAIIIVSVIPTFMTIGICQATPKSKETRKFVLVTDDLEKNVDKKDNLSFSDYVTWSNMVAVTVVLATGGAGAGAVIGGVLKGTLAGAGAGALTGAGAGAAAGVSGSIAAAVMKSTE